MSRNLTVAAIPTSFTHLESTSAGRQPASHTRYVSAYWQTSPTHPIVCICGLSLQGSRPHHLISARLSLHSQHLAHNNRCHLGSYQHQLLGAMQSTQGSSKGKGRAGDEDGDYAQSLASLSLSDPASLSLSDRGGLAPPSDSCGSSYTGVYSPSTYSGYTGYDTASVTSRSAPSSYGGGSVSGWSDAQTTSTASSAPTAFSNQTDVNNTIHRQRPPNERYQLPCEFRNLTLCDQVFPGDDVQGWMGHIEGHLQSKFPTRLRCCK